jgi:SAM-dependent methyltransferase
MDNQENISKCQICSNPTREVLNLGDNPPCDFLNEDQFSQEVKYPIIFLFCPTCSLLQLGEIVSQEDLFTPKSGYHHIAELSSSFKAHLKVLAKEMVERFDLKAEDLVVELGSNDGALLEAFRDEGVKVLGVDPTDVIDIASQKNLTTIPEFFTEETGEKIVKEYGHAKVIAALNTFAHVADLHSVVRGIKKLLSPEGVFVSENHHALDLIEGLQYDFIYHEHLREYSLKSLVHLFGMHDMEVFDVEHLLTHSGSIRVFAGHRGAHKISGQVNQLLEKEAEFGLGEEKVYEEFALKVKEHQKVFTQMLHDIVAEGKTIAGLTFPARAVTLLNSNNIGPETLCYITEMSKIKIGKFSPGTHIPVVDQEILFGNDAPDYGLLLSWHIADEIIPRFRSKGFKGKIIIPLPTPRIEE